MHGPTPSNPRLAIGPAARSLLAVAAAVSVALAATAPTAALDAPSGAGSDVAGQQGSVTVTWYVGLGTGRTPDEAAIQEQVVDDFNVSHPAIHLEIVSADPETGIADLRTLTLGGEAPDVVGPMGFRGLGAFAGHWADLTPLAEATATDVAAFPAGLLKAATGPRDALTGLPYAVYPTVLFYDRTLFDQAGLSYPPHAIGEAYPLPDGTEAPWDYGTLARVARLLTLDSKGRDATHPRFDPDHIVQYGFHTQFTDDLSAYAAALTGDWAYVAEDGSVAIPDGWRETATWLHDAHFGARPFMPSGTAVAGKRLANNPFASGRVAMAQAPLWYTCCLTDASGTERVTQWDLAVLPRSSAGATVSPTIADWLAIPEASGHKDEAFEVLRYLLDSDALQGVYGTWPARTDRQDLFTAALDERFGQHVDWSVARAMQEVPEDPSRQADVPGWPGVQQLITDFTRRLQAEPRLDLDAALDALQADIAAIVGG